MLCKLLISTLALVSMSAIASAADLPNTKSAPLYTPPPPVLSWTGFYVGGTAGAGWSHQSYTTDPGGTLVSFPFNGSQNWGSSLDTSSRVGFTGGGEIGYNWQVSQLVFGAEADFQYYGGEAKGFSSATPGAIVTSNASTSSPWFGTVRGRIGTTFLNPAVLVYATGGFAYGHERRNAYVAVDLGATPLEAFPFSESGTRIGYTVGGGVEWKFAPHWSLKAEYLYVNLASLGGETEGTTVFGPSAIASDVMHLNSSRLALNVARIGINYQFDLFVPPAPLVAKY